MDTMSCFVHRILFLGAIVFISASANLMIENNWPEPDPNINHFPHESSCHYYYLMLSEEEISIQKCPDGQLFDYLKHSCISDKEHIHCWSRRFGKTNHGHKKIKHKKHFECPYPWGKFPNLHDCTKYHLCFNGRPRARKCAPFELFDKISRKCIASIDAVCADKTDVEHGYICPKTWGSFPYSKDCSKYHECLKRKPNLRTCQKGYLFDDRLAKCVQKEHAYCGLRYNPYEKVSTVVPETPFVSKITSTQKSTSLNLDVTTEKITSVKPVSQETPPQETSTTIKEISSLPQETSSTSYEVSSIQAPANQPTTSKISSPPANNKEMKQEATSEANHNEIKQEATSEATEIKQEATSKANHNEIKQESTSEATEIKPKSSMSSANPDVVKLEKEQATSDVTEEVSVKNEFVEVSSTTEKEQASISSQILFNDDSEDLKKDVSTEEKDTDDVSTKLVTAASQGIEIVSKASPVSSDKTGCAEEDPMCVTEKDGTVVKCSSTKDLQPHPKDERRFVDCTESKIKIYTCPDSLTFRPDSKKCKWQFIL